MGLGVNDIHFQPEAFDLISRIEKGTGTIFERSVQTARQRCSQTVLPQDVRAALESIFTEIAAAFTAAGSGAIAEVEFSDQDFGKLTKLPFHVPDLNNPDDDTL